MFPFCRPSNTRTITWTLVNGTSVGGDFVASALGDGDPSLPLWVTETSVGVQGNAGSAVRIDGVSVHHHNFRAGTDVRLRIHSAASWGGAVDITITVVVPAWQGRFAPHLYFDVATAVPVVLSRTRQYLFLDNLSDANDVGVKVGEVLVLGEVEELEVGLMSGAQMPVEYGRSLSPSRAPMHVASVHDYRTRQRSWVGETVLDTADKTLLRALQDDSYGVRPFVGWPTGRVEDEPIFGRFIDPSYAPTVTHVDVADSAPFTFEELSCGEAY